MSAHKIILPPPAGHYYEWDGPYGKRKFTTAPHNGRECNRAVAYYTEDQVVAAIETALQSPEIQALQTENEALRRAVSVLEGAMKLIVAELGEVFDVTTEGMKHE